MAAGDKVRDLLDDGPPGRPLDIKHGPAGIYLPGLTEKLVSCCLCEGCLVCSGLKHRSSFAFWDSPASPWQCLKC